MELRKVSDIQPVTDYLAETIGQQLHSGKPVLWLVPGGSAMAVAVATAKQLAGQPLTRLIVSLTDERYGEVGHPDSNWQQLKDLSFVLPGATMIPVLIGKDLPQTAQTFSARLADALASVDYRIALAGMGPDGHLLGIKPNSPAVASQDLAIGYQWEDYQRITITAEVIKQLDEIVVYATGEPKWQQLADLAKNLPANQQPAQLLKTAKRVIIYNDYKEGTI